MSNKPSRRELLGVAAIGVVASAIPMTAAAQPKPEVEVDAVSKELAKPLSPEAQKLLEEALKGIETSRKDRLKTKLPENSEPCFTYFPSQREVRSR